MDKIKCVHIITRFDKGGSSENTFLTAVGLNKTGYEVVLIKGLSHESQMERPEAEATAKNLLEAGKSGVRIITLAHLVRKIRPLHDLLAFSDLVKILKQEKPRIVHTHTSKAGILGRLAARIAGVPVIIHTPHGHVFYGYFGKGKTAFYILLEKLAARITDKIITLTEREKREHVEFLRISEEKLTVIHSGVDMRKFPPSSVDPGETKRKTGIPVGACVVGAVGRLTAVKGHIHLLAAAAKVIAARSDTVFILLGDGELKSELAEAANKLGIKEKVRFLGWRSDVADIMSAFDIFVFPSLNEGMGKVLVEAMAAGKPIIASDVCGVADLITHGKNGLLVPPADPQALADGIESLLSDPARARELAAEGRKLAQSYSSDAMLTKIEELYRSLLNEKSSSGAGS